MKQWRISYLVGTMFILRSSYNVIIGMSFYKVEVLDQLCILFFHENRVISMHLVHIMEMYVVFFIDEMEECEATFLYIK